MDRLFFAVELEKQVREEISARAARLKGLWPGARWVKPCNYHLTLLFIGRFPGSLDDLQSAGCQAAEHQGSVLSVHAWGFFPHQRHPRVAFAAVEDRNGVLAGISHKLSGAAQPDKNPSFHPHVTVARNTGLRPGPEADFGPPVPFACRHFTLFNSVLGPTGPRYTPLARFDLQGIARSE